MSWGCDPHSRSHMEGTQDIACPGVPQFPFPCVMTCQAPTKPHLKHSHYCCWEGVEVGGWSPSVKIEPEQERHENPPVLVSCGPQDGLCGRGGVQGRGRMEEVYGWGELPSTPLQPPPAGDAVRGSWLEGAHWYPHHRPGWVGEAKGGGSLRS